MLESLILVELRDLKVVLYLKDDVLATYRFLELFKDYKTIPVSDLYINPKELDLNVIQFCYKPYQSNDTFRMAHIGAYSFIKKES